MKTILFILLLTIYSLCQLQYTQGSYTGTGAEQAISLDFEPELVVTFSTGRYAIFKTYAHGGDSSSFFDLFADVTNEIKTLSSSGFTVGSGANSNTDGALVYYFALSGGDFEAVRYRGNSTDNRQITTSFTPAMVWVKEVNSTSPQGWRSTTHNTNQSSRLYDGGSFADNIQDFGSNYFELGTNVHTNQNGIHYVACVFKSSTYIELFTYTGNLEGNDRIIELTSNETPLSVMGGSLSSGTPHLFKSTDVPADTSYYFTDLAAVIGRWDEFDGGNVKVDAFNNNPIQTYHAFVFFETPESASSNMKMFNIFRRYLRY